MNGSGLQRRAKAPFVATLVFSVVAGLGAAAAQTVIQTAPPDPLVSSLRDRIDALEQQVRTLTGDNEKLQFELSRAKEESARLNKALDDLNAQTAAAQAPPPAAGKLGDIPAAAAAAASGDAAGDYAHAYALVAKGDSKGGEDAFTAFLAAYPSDAKAPDAHYWLGQSLLAQNHAPDAAAHFLNVIQRTPKAAIAPQAMVRLGVALNRMGQKEQACGTLKAVPTQYPKASAETRAAAAANIKSIGC
ncbi:MAG: tol-pal system protein YbgF [Pseudomonadota bacterium]